MFGSLAHTVTSRARILSNEAPSREALLGIYLDDHLAGATVGIELARRCAGNNSGTPLGAHLHALIDELRDDRAIVHRLVERYRSPSTIKRAGAWAAERAGRLKLNGQLTGYSPLSRLEELEGLCSGIEAKRAMWVVLDDLGLIPPAELGFTALAERASRQRDGLEPFRLEAARRAFASPRHATA